MHILYKVARIFTIKRYFHALKSSSKNIKYNAAAENVNITVKYSKYDYLLLSIHVM